MSVQAQSAIYLPPVLNATIISFSFTPHIPPSILTDSSQTGSFARVLRRDIQNLLGVEYGRVLITDISLSKEADPYPDFVTMQHDTDTSHEQLLETSPVETSHDSPSASHVQALLARSEFPTAKRSGKDVNGSDGSNSGSKLRTFSLELLRVTLCILPASLGVATNPSQSIDLTPDDVYSDQLVYLLHQLRTFGWKSAFGSSSSATSNTVPMPVVMPAQDASLLNGNYTRFIHPLIPFQVTYPFSSPWRAWNIGADGSNTTSVIPLLKLCVESVSGTNEIDVSYKSFPYFLQDCPFRDPTLYWGSTGLLAAILIAVCLFLILFFAVWILWSKQETKKKLNTLRSIKASLGPKSKLQAADLIMYGEHNTTFLQQALAAWSPTWSVAKVTIWMVVLGVGLLIPLGGYFFSINSSLVDVQVRYDNLPQCDMNDPNNDPANSCYVDVTITHDMRAPVYFYYHLNNFYQNHRNYVMSRSDPQLRNAVPSKRGNSVGTLSTECAALKTFGDYARASSVLSNPLYPFYPNQTAVLDSKVLYPCGLIAASYFTDKFTQAYVTTPPLMANSTISSSTASRFVLQGRNWADNDIAWKSDIDSRFRARDLDVSSETNLMPRGMATSAWDLAHIYPGVQPLSSSALFPDPLATTTSTSNTPLPDSSVASPAASSYFSPIASASSPVATMTSPALSSEHFMVWMRTAPFSSFAKINHKILDRNLHAGEVVRIRIENNFDVRSFNGEKSVVLSTANMLGTRNAFFGMIYVIVGGIYGLTALVLFLVYRRDPEAITVEETLELTAQMAKAQAIRSGTDGVKKETMRSTAPVFNAARVGGNAAMNGAGNIDGGGGSSKIPQFAAAVVPAPTAASSTSAVPAFASAVPAFASSGPRGSVEHLTVF